MCLCLKAIVERQRLRAKLLDVANGDEGRSRLRSEQTSVVLTSDRVPDWAREEETDIVSVRGPTD